MWNDSLKYWLLMNYELYLVYHVCNTINIHFQTFPVRFFFFALNLSWLSTKQSLTASAECEQTQITELKAIYDDGFSHNMVTNIAPVTDCKGKDKRKRELSAIKS